MHSQAQLIQHLNAVRSYLVVRHADVVAGDQRPEGCICCASEMEAGHDASEPVHVAVKQMVIAEFEAQGKTYSGTVYLYPIRIDPVREGEAGNYYGTEQDVTAGHTSRRALIDRWIADAHKKLLAAVFRKAIDLLVAKEHYFMCNAIKQAACTLEGGGNWWEYESALLTQACAVLVLFKPDSVDMSAGWYSGYKAGPQISALRIAILNLCITEVTRGFK